MFYQNKYFKTCFTPNYLNYCNINWFSTYHVLYSNNHFILLNKKKIFPWNCNFKKSFCVILQYHPVYSAERKVNSNFKKKQTIVTIQNKRELFLLTWLLRHFDFAFFVCVLTSIKPSGVVVVVHNANSSVIKHSIAGRIITIQFQNVFMITIFVRNRNWLLKYKLCKS